MARNQDGIYTTPNSFQVNTTANPDRVNENFNDLGNEITGSLARDGRGGMTGQLKVAAGTLASPGLVFTGDLNTGFMFETDGAWSFVVNGTKAFTLGTKGLQLAASAPVFDLGTQSAGTVTVDYDNGPVQKVLMAGNITLMPADIPEGSDLQLNLTFSSGDLAFSGVTRWAFGTDDPSTSFDESGLTAADLPAGCVLTFIFSRVGTEIIGFVARVK